ncbi:uncharacterized protein [Excalfactoria chinensis]|uniref:uncharacterized protein n=1 Tax=Excalfactoria chinensis TaxID=46218 RepID=UPI003B3B7367
MDPAAGERQPLRAPQRSARPEGGRSRRAPAADVACPDVPAQMCRRCRRMAISSFPDNRSSGGWRRRHGIPPPPPTPSGFFWRAEPGSGCARTRSLAARRGRRCRSNDEPQTLPSPPTRHVRPPPATPGRTRWMRGAAPGQPGGGFDGPGRRRPSPLPTPPGGGWGWGHRFPPPPDRRRNANDKRSGGCRAGYGQEAGGAALRQPGGGESGRAPRAACPTAAGGTPWAAGRGAESAVRGCASIGTRYL